MNQDKIVQLLEWTKNNKSFVSDKVRFVDEENAGIIGQAVEDIDGNELLISCDESIIIGPKLSDELFNPPVEIRQIAIKLCLVCEKLKGDESKFKEYIQLLPTKLDMPCYWNQTDLKWIEGANLDFDIDIRTQRYKDEFARAQKELKLNSDYTFEDYHWACNIFSSRSFPANVVYSDNDYADTAILLPIIDLLNHKPLEPIYWTGNDKHFQLSAGKSIKKGQQVYNNYGAKGNEELLLSSGFTIDNNPVDNVALKLGEPHPSIIAAVPDFPDNRLFYLTKFDPLPELLVKVFTETSKLQDSYEIDEINTVSGLEMLKPALMAKYYKIDKKVNSLDTPSNYHQTCALEYLKGQQDIYQLTIAALKSRIDSIKSHFTPLELCNNNNTLKIDPSIFGADSEDDLINYGQEETCIIIHLVKNVDLSHIPPPSEAEQQQYQPLQQSFADQNPDINYSLELLAKAGSVLRQRGYTYHDDKARERFCVLWGGSYSQIHKAETETNGSILIK